MMMDAKRQALMDMKSMLKGAKANKMKVMVAGNNPEAVKEGLDKAEDVVEEMPSKGMVPQPKQDPKVMEMVSTMSPEQKQQLLKMLMSETGMEEGEEDENEMC